MIPFNLDLIRKGHPIETTDGRKLIFILENEGGILCRTNENENPSFWSNAGKWCPEFNINGSSADIVMSIKNTQLSLF
jgi:hypothetical protein